MRVVFLSLLILALSTACGDKIPLPVNVDDDSNGNLTDTTFVPILPHWTEANGIPFNYPFGVNIGYDRTIFISDTRNDRIVRVTATGEFIESFPIPHPHGVAQDRAFTLMAVNEGNQAWIKREGSSEFTPYVEEESTYVCIAQPNAPPICYWDVPRFTSITATRLSKSVFYVARAGQVSAVFGDEFQPQPQFYPILPTGGGYGQIYSPIDVEFTMVGNQGRLLVSQYGGVYGVQYLALPEYRPAIADSFRDVFQMPLDDVKYLAADERGNVFVLHRANGIVMMFDKDGHYVLTFGRDGTDQLSLQDATGIAVLDDIILIADAKNNRIARYQVTAIPQN